MNYIKSASICILSLIILCACNSKPKHILSQEQMVSIGVDLRLAEAYLVKNLPAGTSSDSIKALTIKVYEPIFGKYGISVDDYKQSVEYYLLKPQKMQDINIKISDNLKQSSRGKTK